MKRRISAAIAMGLIASTANGQDGELKDYSGSYMCRPIGIAGVVYDENSRKWQATTFNENKRQHFVKYTMVHNETMRNPNGVPYREYRMLINRADLPGLSPSGCVSDIIKGAEASILPMYTDRISCSSQSGDFTFSFGNMRYQLINDGGYLIDAPSLTPYIEVGMCVRLD